MTRTMRVALPCLLSWLAVAAMAPGGGAMVPGDANGVALVLEEAPAVLEAAGSFELSVTVTNVSGGTLRILRWGLGDECGLAVFGPDGREVPGEFGRDKTREIDEGDVCSLGAGESRRFALGARWDGEGHLLVDEPQGGVHSFTITRSPVVLRARLAFDPAGTFGKELTDRFGALWSGRVLSSPREVVAAGVAAERGLSVAGLALSLRAGRSEFSMKPLNLRRALRDAPHYEIDPVALTVTFLNCSTEPLCLDAFDVVWSRLALSVEGPAEHAVVMKPIVAERLLAAPVAADYPVIPPGGNWSLPAGLRFPGPVGGMETILNAPGAYRARLLYRASGVPVPEAAHPRPGARTWAGEVASNAIGLTGVEAGPTPDEDRPK